MRPRGPPAYSERADLLTMTMSLAREGRQSRPTELRTGREAALPLPDHLGAWSVSKIQVEYRSPARPKKLRTERALSSNPWTWA